MKVCSKCDMAKPLSDFYKNTKNKDGYYYHCKLCQNAYVRQHYQDNKEYYVDKAVRSNARSRKRNREYLISYLNDNPCKDCGNIDTEVLQFDHRDPSMKLYNVATLTTYSLQKLIDEVSKCDVRCGNCHTKKTRRQFGWWTSDSP